MNPDLLLYINQALIGVVGYFVVKTMNRLELISIKTLQSEVSLALLKQETGFKHDRLEEKLDTLNMAISILTAEIKQLNKKTIS